LFGPAAFKMPDMESLKPMMAVKSKLAGLMADHATRQITLAGELTKTSGHKPLPSSCIGGELAGLSAQSGRDCVRTYYLTVSRLAPPQLLTK
jgi:hypothetical protein